MQGRFGVDPYQNYMADSINWGVLFVGVLLGNSHVGLRRAVRVGQGNMWLTGGPCLKPHGELILDLRGGCCGLSGLGVSVWMGPMIQDEVFGVEEMLRRLAKSTSHPSGCGGAG